MKQNYTVLRSESPGMDEFAPWKRVAIVADTGLVFLPGAVFLGSDRASFDAALYGGCAIVTHEAHLYLDSMFLACAIPEKAADIIRVATDARASAMTDPRTPRKGNH